MVAINENTNFKDISEKVVLKDGESYLLLPGQACLGITVEKVQLSSNLCGLLEGRSRFARMGLFVVRFPYTYLHTHFALLAYNCGICKKVEYLYIY